jgi:hypothetical protein
MVVQKDLTFAGVTHPVIFNSAAMFKLEKETGLSTDRIGMMLVTGRAGFQIMHYILFAGLEAARVRNKTRREPFTIEEVGDLMDSEGGPGILWASPDDGIIKKEVEENGEKKIVEEQVREPRPAHPIATAMIEAWTSAFPKTREERELKQNPPVPAEQDPSLGTSE